VTKTTAYLDHVTLTTCPNISVNGGLLFAYNNRLRGRPYGPDRDPNSVTYRYCPEPVRALKRLGSLCPAWNPLSPMRFAPPAPLGVPTISENAPPCSALARSASFAARLSAALLGESGESPSKEPTPLTGSEASLDLPSMSRDATSLRLLGSFHNGFLLERLPHETP
jgi:hypothetical protein